MMAALQIDDFGPFFTELWGYEPFPWQQRLARQVHGQGWPAFIDLPTASGKTACLDVAVFTLAMQAQRAPEERTVGRRIFFVVNRRVIVDEAHERAKEIARKLFDAPENSILRQVSAALLKTSGDPDSPPLDVALLRGGIVRDNRWARSATQPTIITSTVDQVGSRLLFRGYGVTDAAKPLHAALVAHDSLVLLDEAHISQPFVQTLNAVKRYRGGRWAETPIQTPFDFVQMTATPGGAAEAPFSLESDDQAALKDRHDRNKPVHLIEAQKAKGKEAIEKLAHELAEQALRLLSPECRNIAVVVNRIATARLVAQMLRDNQHGKKTSPGSVHLTIGRMRPIDRDHLTSAVQARVGKTGATSNDEGPMFVVATQCLEVGADFDFDGMVSECASLDALRQRFGRLNRRGREIDARGAIVIRADQTKNDDDPIYGAALSKTWEWLQHVAQNDIVDFAVNSMTKLAKNSDLSSLQTPRENAPVMFPAYMDAWAQTSPVPMPDPDVSLFLHGPKRGVPDVQVCWRDDLDLENTQDWQQIVALCPPSSPECMTVPINMVRKWLAEQDLNDEEQSDLLEGKEQDNNLPLESAARRKRQQKTVLLWRGPEKSALLSSSNELRPGDTVVVPVSLAGWDALGHVPGDAPKDIAEEAFNLSSGRVALRLRPDRLCPWDEKETASELQSWLRDPEVDMRDADIRALLRAAADEIQEEPLAERMRILSEKQYGLEWERYPDQRGVVLRTRRPVKAGIIPSMDDGDDMLSRTARTAPTALEKHLRHVTETLQSTLDCLALPDTADALIQAVERHDWGKADERFQAMLLNGALEDAWARKDLYAKSGRMPATPAARRAARQRAGLPEGFRHEMLSAQLAEFDSAYIKQDFPHRELVLHLISSHHGYGRPFAPVVFDEHPPDVALDAIHADARITAEQRRQLPAHRLNSGIAERFWKLTRRFGWWGLAYLEAVLRLADQRASQAESENSIE